jgi:hypothetical protein
MAAGNHTGNFDGWGADFSKGNPKQKINLMYVLMTGFAHCSVQVVPTSRHASSQRSNAQK